MPTFDWIVMADRSAAENVIASPNRRSHPWVVSP